MKTPAFLRLKGGERNEGRKPKKRLLRILSIGTATGVCRSCAGTVPRLPVSVTRFCVLA